MPGLVRYRALATRERALVAVAVLLDGFDAIEYLSCDKDRQTALTRAARDLAELAPELRMPLLGSMLRSALNELATE